MMSRRRRSPLGCQETVQPHAKAAGFNITLIRAIRSDGKLSLIKLILAGGDDHRGGGAIQSIFRLIRQAPGQLLTLNC